MANQQLVSYIKQQIQLGETEVPIKNSLKSVGWPEADINDAFKEVSPSAPVVAAPSAVAPVVSQPAQKPAVSNVAPQEPKKFNLNAFGGGPAVMSRPGIANASPAAISFSPQASAVGSPLQGNAPTTSSPVSNFAPIVSEESKKSGHGGMISMIVMGVLIVGLGLVSGYLYKMNSDLKAKVSTAESNLNALAGKVSVPDTSAPSADSSLKALQDNFADIESQLALFLPLRTTTSSVAGAGASSTPTIVTTVVPITLKGLLAAPSTSSKNLYVLTTSKGIAVSVKNSKDAAVESSLRPFVNTQVQLTGTQTAGAREITVTHINGSPIVKAAPAAPAPTTTAPIVP